MTSSAPLNRPLAALDIAQVHAILAEQEAEGRALIAAESVAASTVTAAFSADMQFVGQTHLLRVPLPSATPSLADLQSRFERAYHDALPRRAARDPRRPGQPQLLRRRHPPADRPRRS